MKKLLSIIVPAYNMEKYLHKTLSSLLVSEDDLIQLLDVLVINDGSADGTSIIAHQFESQYPGVVRVIDKCNGNYGSCINVGLGKISGEFVKVLDADDCFDTSSFATYLKCLKTVPDDVELVLTDYSQVDLSGKEIRCFRNSWLCDSAGRLSAMPDGLIKAMFLPMITFRSEIFNGLSYHQSEGISYSDQEWDWYPMAKVKKYIYLPVSVYRYLMGREGQTADLNYWRKNFWMFQKVIGRMATDFHSVLAIATEESKRYLKVRLQSRVAIVYDTTLRAFYDWGLGALSRDETQLLVEFDHRIKEHAPELYGEHEAAKWQYGLPFHYVSYFRKTQGDAGLYFRIARLYSKCMGKTIGYARAIKRRV